MSRPRRVPTASSNASAKSLTIQSKEGMVQAKIGFTKAELDHLDAVKTAYRFPSRGACIVALLPAKVTDPVNELAAELGKLNRTLSDALAGPDRFSRPALPPSTVRKLNRLIEAHLARLAG